MTSPPEWIWQIMYSAVFSKEDREKMEQAFKDAADAVEVMITEGQMRL